MTDLLKKRQQIEPRRNQVNSHFNITFNIRDFEIAKSKQINRFTHFHGLMLRDQRQSIRSKIENRTTNCGLAKHFLLLCFRVLSKFIYALRFCGFFLNRFDFACNLHHCFVLSIHNQNLCPNCTLHLLYVKTHK